MLNRLKSLLSGASAGAAAPSGDERARLASAVLLVEAALMDGAVAAAERAHILSCLRERFGLSHEEAEDLFREADSAAAESVQLHAFTRSIKDSFSFEERVKLIEMLWEVAYADGHLHDYEANLVRRIGGLIYVPDVEGGAARKRAMARLGIPE